MKTKHIFHTTVLSITTTEEVGNNFPGLCHFSLSSAGECYAHLCNGRYY